MSFRYEWRQEKAGVDPLERTINEIEATENERVITLNQLINRRQGHLESADALTVKIDQIKQDLGVS